MKKKIFTLETEWVKELNSGKKFDSAAFLASLEKIRIIRKREALEVAIQEHLGVSLKELKQALDETDSL